MRLGLDQQREIRKIDMIYTDKKRINADVRARHAAPQRKQIRLKGYDYSQSGWYFVTVCTFNRENIFGDIVGATLGSPAYMKLNEFGKIIESIWQSLPKHHPVELDVFQIMPNHVHFIIHIFNTNRTRPYGAGGSRPAPTTKTKLGTVIGLFKSECSKQIHIVGATRGSPEHTRGSPKIHIWQRNYYEQIIRNETDLHKIREYIQSNPLMWERDRNNVQ